MTCKDCKFADWDRTKAGRMHPSGLGRCTYTWVAPPLPKVMYFTTKPHPVGGLLDREDMTDPKPCPCHEPDPLLYFGR